jgi:vacuolar-type H+-ATPase subunit B/Vma2
MTTTKIKKREYLYNLEIMYNNDSLKIEGDGLLPLLQSFQKPFLKTKVCIIVKKNGIMRRRDLNIFEANRLFENKVKLELFASNLDKQLN